MYSISMAKQRQTEHGELLKGNTPTLLLAVFLAGPDSGWITGETLLIAGGLR